MSGDQRPGRVLRVATFNVKHGLTAARGVDNALLAKECETLDADILAVQEIERGRRRSGRADQPALVAEATGMAVAFAAADKDLLGGRFGNALFVRGEIRDVEELALPRYRRKLRRSRPRVALLATVEAGGITMSVAATHLEIRYGEARAQLDKVLARLVRRPPPRLLLGDLNISMKSAGRALLAAGLTAVDVGPTFPASEPRAQIDHIAVGDATIVTASSELTMISDHRAVVAMIAPRAIDDDAQP